MFCRSGNARGSDSHVLRPMITACPTVSARKRLRSSARRHGNRLSAPMTPFAATAAISATAGDGIALFPVVICELRVGADRWGVIIAANYSGGARVLPPFLPQIHPAGLPAGEP